VNVDFPGTGSWDTWATAAPIPANLVAGRNTIRATSTTAKGGPTVDYLAVEQSPPPPPPPPNRLEAEGATCEGTVDSDHAGFSGIGFCNTTNAVGASVQWSVNA